MPKLLVYASTEEMNRSLDPDVAEGIGGRIALSRILELNGLVSSPTYSFLEAVADIKKGIEDKVVENLTVRDLDDMIRSCHEYVKDLLQFGTDEATNISLEDGYDDRLMKEDFVMAISLYSSQIQSRGVYVSMNSIMRRPNREGIEPFLRFAWLLMHALSCCKPYLGRLVCRGMRVSDMRYYSEGKLVVWHAFNSCSTDLPAATSFLRERVDQRQGFLKVLFIIELTSFRGRTVSRYSVLPDEKEVLLPPNTAFKVMSVPVNAGDFYIVHMSEVSHSDPVLAFSGLESSSSTSLLPGVTQLSEVSPLE